MRVEIRTAAEILTPERAGEWAARRAQRDDPLLRAIWREFVEAGGPVSLEAACAGRCRDSRRRRVRARAAALDAADLIGLDADRVTLAYPFTAEPNDFEVVASRRPRRAMRAARSTRSAWRRWWGAR